MGPPPPSLMNCCRSDGIWQTGDSCGMLDMPRQPGRAPVRPTSQLLTVCPRAGTLTSASFRACNRPPVGNGSTDGTRERRRVLSGPAGGTGPRGAGRRSRGPFRSAPYGAGWTAVSRAATLLVCAAFCLEPHQDNFLGGPLECTQTVAYRSSAASAAPVLGRTHLGSFPPCEDQPYVE